MYRVTTNDDYLCEQRVIKHEYRSGVMDPSREVARIEKKRNKLGLTGVVVQNIRK